eukprot:CAMPEP_0115732912 /NCGR_PEP_ID=MMETSP0272-20121206/85377_1 /TAXON_ID=71861 /ORGANISM="Scrippsiella trochoidea, Strain CCMP3099" /LENGTH=96 /DNA_ID=CAMNT_0003176859 /DNA_START=490 /DNA_END=777 /DNA_ORIENTATION=+
MQRTVLPRTDARFTVRIASSAASNVEYSTMIASSGAAVRLLEANHFAVLAEELPQLVLLQSGRQVAHIHPPAREQNGAIGFGVNCCLVLFSSNWCH